MTMSPNHDSTLIEEGLSVSEERFKDQFATELLHSEQLRVKVLLGLFIFGTAYSAALWLLALAGVRPEYSQSGPSATIVFVLFVLYEAYLLRFLIKKQRLGLRVHPAIWYLNALLEVSIPTIVILGSTLNEELPIMYLSYPIVAVYAIFIVLSTLRLDARLSIFTGVVAAMEFMALSVYFLGLTPVDVDLVPRLLSPVNYASRAVVLLLTGTAAAFVAREIRRRLFSSFEILEERNQIRDVFGQHTAPDVVDALLREGSDMKSQRRQVTIMFLDIRGFTAFSEKRDPEEVVAYLNTLFAFMIDHVNDNKGIIHQLLGDGFMAIFGAPVTHGGNSQQAVDAALAILAQVAEEEAAGHIPPTRIGIGLHAGEVVAGTVGSAIHKEYKVTGDVVNLASRIEQLNKKYNSQVLISEAVQSGVHLHGVEAVEMGSVDVRGRAEPVRIYRLA